MTLSHAPAFPLTANDRLKRGFELRLALSFMVAVLVHFLCFQLWPAMEVPGVWSVPADAVSVISMDRVELPPAPEPLTLPRVPVPSAHVPSDATLTPPRWDDRAILPEPLPATPVGSVTGAPAFVPRTAEPELLNPGEVQRALTREWPPTLRDAGIGGTVFLLVHVGTGGEVLEVRGDGTSGTAMLDAAALRVADVFRFRAAMNRDQPVAVWIRLPVTFRVR